jgi:hypothetical protein
VQEHKQQLQQEAEELQEQLADMQRLYEQQQLMLQELQCQQQQLQQQQPGSEGLMLPSISEAGVGTSTVGEAVVRQQQQQQLEEAQLPGASGEQLYQNAAEQQQQQHATQLDSQPQLQQTRDAAGVGEHLPVSVPASIDADASRHGPAAAAANAHRVQRSYMPGDYASAVEDASSAAGSMVDSSLSGTAVGLQHWEDDSTASSNVASGRSWFGMFGKRNSKQGRSALV